LNTVWTAARKVQQNPGALLIFNPVMICAPLWERRNFFLCATVGTAPFPRWRTRFFSESRFVRHCGNGAIFAEISNSEVHGSEAPFPRWRTRFFSESRFVRHCGNGAIFAEISNSEVHGSEVHGFFQNPDLCATVGTAQFSRRLAIKVQTIL